MEGNKMNIRYRIMMADRSQQPFSKSLTESDSSGDYAKHASSIADVMIQGSQDSLDKHFCCLPRMKSYDAAVLYVPPEEFARQITLMDLQVFQKIQPDELTSCAWSNKENKFIKAPNVVAFTRRFNDITIWVLREILNTGTDETRVKVLAHFIKIGKKLLELNNLHAAMAVVSALQSAVCLRISNTWMKLRKKDKQSYEKMVDLLSPNNNRHHLRDYMDSVKQPCIPYLGLYLSDLIYIDAAHPHHGGMESHTRRLQMNNILRVIADLQQSTYDLGVKEYVQSYLKSAVYIEEQETFVEDHNYELPLTLEPRIANQTMNTSPEDVSTCPPSPCSEPRHTNIITPGPSYTGKPHDHRHSKSLSANSLSYTSAEVERTNSLPIKTTAPYIKDVRHLLDDSVLEEESPCVSNDGSLCKTAATEAVSELGFGNQESHRPVNDIFQSNLDTSKQYQNFTCEGFLKRKTKLKDGRKPIVAAWTRYWVALSGTNVLYFPAKIGRKMERRSFKSKPNKMMSILGWTVVMGDDPLQPDAFQIIDPVNGHKYKFRAGTQAKALLWCQHLSESDV